MIKAYNSVFKVAVKEVYKAKIVKKTADGKVPLEVALMQQVRSVYNQIKGIILRLSLVGSNYPS